MILSTISSTSPNVRPFFYLFSITNTADRRCNNYLIVPFYFLFTSISYLIRKKGEIANIELLISMIRQTYLKILKSEFLSSGNWDFLRKFLEKYFEIPRIDESFDKKVIYRYDPLTVSFIYNEMKLGGEDEVGKFFTQVWEACKKESVGKRDSIQICNAPLLNIPVKKDNVFFTFEPIASKLYQMKFTDLLFGEWETMSGLLDGYDELRKDFNSILYDFRFRVFSLIDFKSLDKSLEKIDSLLAGYSFDKKKKVKFFFTELECFINFKCILFTRDFCLNVKQIKTSESYQSSFILITSIHNKFEKIRSTLSNRNIKLGSINYEFVNQKKPFSLKTLVENLSALTKSFSVESIQGNLEFQELSHYLESFDYFDHDLNNLSFLSRFQWIEFLAELKGFMDCNAEASIDGIFLHDQYKEVRKYGLKKFTGYFGHSPSKKVPKHHVFSLNEKKYFFNEFTRFIIYYNQ